MLQIFLLDEAGSSSIIDSERFLVGWALKRKSAFRG